jgi:hypothetical protein
MEMDKYVRNKSKRKWIVAIGLVLIFTLSLPSLLSTPWGKSLVLSYVNHKIPGKIDIRTLNLSWFGKQTLENFTLEDSKSDEVIQIKQVVLNASLVSLIVHRFHSIPSAVITGLDGTIKRNKAENSNLHESLGIYPLPSDQILFPPLDIKLININASCNTSSTGELTQIELMGKLESDGVSGQVEVKGKVEAGNFPDNVKILKVAIDHFPVTLLEQLISLKNPYAGHFLVAAVGKTLNLNLKQQKKEDHLSLDFQAQSSNLKADFSGEIFADGFVLQKPGKATLLVTPELIHSLGKSGSEIIMTKAASIELVMHEMKIPFVRDLLELDLTKIELKGNLNLENAFIEKIAIADSITLHNFHFNLIKNKQSPNLNLDLTGYIDHHHLTSKLQISSNYDLATQGIEIKGTLDPFILTKEFQKYDIVLQNTKFEVKSKSQFLKSSQLKLTTTLASTDVSSFVNDFLGPVVDLQIDGMAHLDKERVFSLTDLHTKLSSKNLYVDFWGEIDKKRQLIFNLPPVISYVLNPSALQAFGIENSLSLKLPSTIKLTIDSIKKPIALFELNKLKLNGKIFIDQLFMGNLRADTRASLIKTSLPWEINAAENYIRLFLEARTALTNNSTNGKINGQMEITNWIQNSVIDLTQFDYKAHLTAVDFPTLMLEIYTNQFHLSSLIGSSIKVDLELISNHDDAFDNNLKIAFEAEKLQGTAHLKIGEYITLYDSSKPISFFYVLEPARFKVLRKLLKHDNKNSDSLVLLDSTECKVNVSNLKLPRDILKPGEPSSLKNNRGEVEANIELNQLKVKDKVTEQFIGFKNVAIHLNSQDLPHSVNMSLKAQQSDRLGNKSNLIVTSELENFITPDHRWNTKDFSLKLEAQAQRLPANLFCEIICLEKATHIKLEALLGSSLDADVSIQLNHMNGPINLLLEGPNGRIHVNAKINDGWLTLNKPFVAEVVASPQLGESVLQDLLPILSGMISGENRLQIHIDPTGFAYPINADNYNQIKISSMTIDLGKIHFSNQGELGKIMAVFKAKPDDVLSVWFTPVYLSIQSGHIHLQRFDMLVMNIFPLAAWGEIDLPDDSINMIIGLTGKSLQNAIGFSLGSSYMMQFPFRGRIGKAKIDKTKAAAKMAALTASLTGTPQGLAIGALIGLASGSLTEKKIPEPTTQPFPWDSSNELKATDVIHNKEKERNSKKTFKALKKRGENLIPNTL